MMRCERHNEEYKYTPFGYMCVSCYNENLLEMSKKGLLNPRKRPSRHIRHYKNGHIRLINANITKRERKVFDKLAKKNVEYGGSITKDKIKVVEGDDGEIDIGGDYPVEWHTHPNTEVLVPSKGDLTGFASEKKAKKQIIFSPKEAIVITKLKKASPKKVAKVYDDVEEKTFRNNLKKNMRKINMEMKIFPKGVGIEG